ncbi:MAG: flagellar biosynthesis protein FlhB [Pseudomonadota bacterium]
MSDDTPDDSSKTEDPTQKKLEDTRNKGQVAHSRDMDAWLLLLGATLLVAMYAPSFMAQMRDLLSTYIANAHDFPEISASGFGGSVGSLLGQVLLLLVLPIFVLLFLAFIGPFAQVGALFAPEVIKPDWDKVSLMKGFGRLFSIRSVVEFTKGLLKISLLGFVMYVILKPHLDGGVAHIIDLSLADFLANFKETTLDILTGALIVLFVLAVADVAYQRYDYYTRLRMTKQEVKDEFKQTEGDPHIRARLRQLRMEKARQRMMQAVPTADVVITNPTHYAIALKYDSDSMEAPTVVAKGVDFLAQKIREVATENKVMIVENPPLARSLYAEVDIDQAIPSEFFKAVAEIITYVYQKQGKLKPRTI